MQLDIIDSYPDFEKLRSNWDAVYDADPEAQFFLSWVLLSRFFSRQQGSWFVLAVKRSGASSDYVAFFPLRLKSRRHRSSSRRYNEISVAGRYFWADYSGFISLPDLENEVIAQFCSQLKRMDWRKLVLKNLAISDHRLKLLTEQFETDQYSLKYLEHSSNNDMVNLLKCPWLDLPDSFEHYLSQQVSANTRQKLRRLLRKLDSSDELLVTHSDPQTHQRDLDILIDYWKDKWASHKGSSLDRLAGKYREILQQGLESNTLMLPVLWQGDHPLAALGIFVDHQKKSLLYFIAGRDESSGNPPPGMMLHAYCIRWAIDNGFGTYDFLRGDERFKYSFGATDRQIHYLVIRARSGRDRKRNPDQ